MKISQHSVKRFYASFAVELLRTMELLISHYMNNQVILCHLYN